jgi:hypothetical protein
VAARTWYVLVIALFALSCSVAGVEPERVEDFSPEYPKNYLVVHQGTPADFAAARCFTFASIHDLSSASVDRRLTAMLAERLPQLKPCGPEWPRLVIEYRAGRGVSLHHADANPSAPYSAFAFVAIENSATTQSPGVATAALAEWQYWRGGSSTLVMEQFVFDFTNLYINQIVKPVPKRPR